LPDLKSSELASAIAKSVFENAGRQIINMTPNSALTVFETGEIDEWRNE